MQRRKTFAKCGEEIGLKAASHPIGIRARGGDGAGKTGIPNSRCQTVDFAGGCRSPLRTRFTDIAAGVLNNPAPVVGNDGNETRPAMNKASATPAKRTDNMARIGLFPKHRHDPHDPHVPNTCGQSAYARSVTCLGYQRFRPAPSLTEL
jgi:hypothetical protein